MLEKEYVDRIEFNQLKEEVNEIKRDMAESQKLLTVIDKKIDVINEKIVTGDKIEELKFMPLEKRINELEDTIKWLRRTVVGATIGLIFEGIMLAIQFLK